jgi:hypothetical protein
MSNMDLYDTLGAIIKQAMEALPDAEAFELAHLVQVATSIRQQAIDVGEQRLKQEAERLMFAVDKEIEDRGGEKYMQQERKASLEHSIRELSTLSTAEIIQRMADLSMHPSVEPDKEALDKYTMASAAELKKRGVVAEFKLTDPDGIFAPAKPEKKIKKIKFPKNLTPNKIINKKTPKGIPNN